MKRIETAAIIGAGALGVLYGQQIRKILGKDKVFFIAEESRIKRYEEEKLYCNGEICDFAYQDTQKEGLTADLIIFTVKFRGLDEAIQAVKHIVGEHTLMLSVLNGIVSEQMIAAVYGEEKVLYSVAQGTDATKQGNHLVCQNLGEIVFGEKNGEDTLQTKVVEDFLNRAGISCRVSHDIMHTLWNKLMLNTGINQVTAALEMNYGDLQKEGKGRTMVIESMKEVQQIAKEEGVTLTDQDIEDWLMLIDRLNPQGAPSMRQDTLNKRHTELVLFSGTIRRLGKQYGIATPVNDWLYAKIREIEASWS